MPNDAKIAVDFLLFKIRGIYRIYKYNENSNDLTLLDENEKVAGAENQAN